MTDSTRALTGTHQSDVQRQDLVDFARIWAPYGGAPEEDTLVRFGMTRPRFDRALWEALNDSGIALDPATVESFIAAYPSPLAHIYRSPGNGEDLSPRTPPPTYQLRTNCLQPARSARRSRTIRRRTFMIGDLVFVSNQDLT